MNTENELRCSLDKLYEIAADARRRTIITVLLNADGEMTLDSLTSKVIVNQDDLSAHKARFIEMELRHRYLPMFSESDFVEYDEEREVVRPRQELDRFSVILPE